jgi:glyoxylase-like metal-dependent hydrolase (beta-lactamase superfamily II)
MIDGGPGLAHAFKKFRKYLKEYSIQPEEFKLMVLTQGDFDHVGSARPIKEFTGAQIAIHENDKPNLEEAIFNWPSGQNAYGKFFHTLFYPFVKNTSFPSQKADITLTDDEFPLKDFGIEGKVICTPWYTQGSVSVLPDSGDAFVGCLTHRGFPFRRKPNLPIFADDLEQIKKSCKIVIKKGAKTIYPGHGKPFYVDEIKKYLQ